MAVRVKSAGVPVATEEHVDERGEVEVEVVEAIEPLE